MKTASNTRIVIIVTGVSDHSVGGQIAKALALAATKYTVVATNMSRTDMKGLPFDDCHVLPRAGATGYLEGMTDLIRRVGATFVAPGSDPELVFLSRQRDVLRRAGAQLLANTTEIIDVCIDKSRTFSALAARGVRVPTTYSLSPDTPRDQMDAGFPWIVKPSSGTGTLGVHIAQDWNELVFFANYVRQMGMIPIAQEYVGTPEDEYTIGVLHGVTGEYLGTYGIHRHILTGLSARLKVPNRTGRADLGPWLAISSGITQGMTAESPMVLKTCQDIADALGSHGPLNIQGRWDGESFVPFEINPRFSGTTSMRAMAGFNEPELLIASHLGLPVDHTRACKKGHFTRLLIEEFEPLENTVGGGDAAHTS